MGIVNFAPKHRIVCAMAVATTLLTWTAKGVARSVPTMARLDYAVATGCPTVADFEAIVAGRLGYDALRDDATDRVLVRVESNGRTLRGRIEWLQASGRFIGEQSFPSRTGDCAELTRAMGFALAVQLQLMAATMQDAAPPPPAAPEAAPPAPPPAPVPRSTAGPIAPPAPSVEAGSPSSPDSRALVLGAGASAGIGVAPTTTGLGRLFGAVAWPRFAFELAAEASLPSTTRRTNGAAFSQEQFVAGLAGCGLRGAWSACVVGRTGAVRVAGSGVDVPLTATALTIQAGLRLAAAHPFGNRTYIVARAEGLTRLTQGTILLDSTPAWTTPRFAALLGIDLAVRFK